MKTPLSLLSVAALVLALPACQSIDGDDGFRKANPFEPGHPGLDQRDDDTQMHDDDDDDCLIWDIKNDTEVNDGDLNLVLTMDARNIYDAANNLRCVVEDGELTEKRIVRVGGGGDPEDLAVDEVLYTLKGNTLYSTGGEALLSFQGHNVIVGPVSNGSVLWTSTSNISKATPFRKALIGALAHGDCGSDGS